MDKGDYCRNCYFIGSSFHPLCEILPPSLLPGTPKGLLHILTCFHMAPAICFLFCHVLSEKLLEDPSPPQLPATSVTVLMSRPMLLSTQCPQRSIDQWTVTVSEDLSTPKTPQHWHRSRGNVPPSHFQLPFVTLASDLCLCISFNFENFRSFSWQLLFP